LQLISWGLFAADVVGSSTYRSDGLDLLGSPFPSTCWPSVLLLFDLPLTAAASSSFTADLLALLLLLAFGQFIVYLNCARTGGTG